MVRSLAPALQLLPWALASAGAASAPAEAPGWRVVPQLAAVAGHNDNLALQPAERVGSAFLTWLPTLALEREDDRSRVTASLRAELTRHADAPRYDTDNLELGADGLHALGERDALAWRVAVQDWRDPVGSSALERLDDAPDHFVAAAGGAIWRRDLDDGRHRLEAEASASHKRYRNHRSATRLADVDTQGLVLRGLRTARPGLQWTVELRGTRARHPFQAAALDHDDWRLLAGLRLEAEPGAARAHAVHLRVGTQRRDFERLRPDLGTVTWDLQGRWQTGAGTWLELAAARTAELAPGDGADHVRQRTWRTAWTQAWTPSWRSTLAASGAVLRYRYGGFMDGEARDDRVTAVDLSLRHEWRPGASVVLARATQRRRSTDPAYPYERDTSTLGVDVRF